MPRERWARRYFSTRPPSQQDVLLMPSARHAAESHLLTDRGCTGSDHFMIQDAPPALGGARGAAIATSSGPLPVVTSVPSHGTWFRLPYVVMALQILLLAFR